MAKQTAEDAASTSASMLQQSRRVWEEIKDKMKNNTLTQKDAQFAACMAAISAASSVAKAASAAANVAYAAAVQAKAMAMQASGDDPSVTHVSQQDKGASLISNAKKAARGKRGPDEHFQSELKTLPRLLELQSLLRKLHVMGEFMTMDPTSPSGKGAKAKGKRTTTRVKAGQEYDETQAKLHWKNGWKSWNLRPSLMWRNGVWIPWREVRNKQRPSSPAMSEDSQDKSQGGTPRSRIRPTKRRKFSDVMEEEDEKSRLNRKSPVTASKAKKPTPKSARKNAEKKRSTSSDVTTDDGGSELRKSSRFKPLKN